MINKLGCISRLKKILLSLFPRNCIRFDFATRWNDRISNSKLPGKYCTILLPRVIMRDRLRYLGHTWQIKDDRLPKIVLIGSRSTKIRLCQSEVDRGRKKAFNKN